MTKNKLKSKKSLKLIKGGSKKKVVSKGKKSFKKVEKGGSFFLGLKELANSAQKTIGDAVANVRDIGQEQSSKVTDSYVGTTQQMEQDYFPGGASGEGGIGSMSIDKPDDFRDLINLISDNSVDVNDKNKSADQHFLLHSMSEQLGETAKSLNIGFLTGDDEGKIVKLIQGLLPLFSKVNPRRDPVLRQAMRKLVNEFFNMIQRCELGTLIAEKMSSILNPLRGIGKSTTNYDGKFRANVQRKGLPILEENQRAAILRGRQSYQNVSYAKVGEMQDAVEKMTKNTRDSFETIKDNANTGLYTLKDRVVGKSVTGFTDQLAKNKEQQTTLERMIKILGDNESDVQEKSEYTSKISALKEQEAQLQKQITAQAQKMK